MVSEARQAFADAANEMEREQQDLPMNSSVTGILSQSFEDAPVRKEFAEDVELTALELKHANAAWLEFHSKVRAHHFADFFNSTTRDHDQRAMKF
eukprot:2276951-Rhodomonas_salina.3